MFEVLRQLETELNADDFKEIFGEYSCHLFEKFRRLNHSLVALYGVLDEKQSAKLASYVEKRLKDYEVVESAKKLLAVLKDAPDDLPVGFRLRVDKSFTPEKLLEMYKNSLDATRHELSLAQKDERLLARLKEAFMDKKFVFQLANGDTVSFDDGFIIGDNFSQSWNDVWEALA